MRPAFSSTQAAAAFMLLLLALLLAPFVLNHAMLPSREEAYASQGWTSGPYPWVQEQIFRERGDIDILFIGSSHILHAIDARRLQDELGKKLGRPATVRVVGWGGAGFDAVHFISRDLLKRRKVSVLVFYNENDAPPVRNNKSPAWFRMADGREELRGLPLREQAYFYFASLVGLPRNLLSLFRSNLPADLRAATPNYWEDHYRCMNIADNLGSAASELGFDARPGADCDPTIPLVPFSPAAPTLTPDSARYSEATRSDFHFSSEPLPEWHTHFAGKFLETAQAHGCKPVLLNIPTLDEPRSATVRERSFWRDKLDDGLTLVGVPTAKLFAGMTDEEMRRFFFNPGHLNKNGQQFFTAIISPTLLELYDAP